VTWVTVAAAPLDYSRVIAATQTHHGSDNMRKFIIGIAAIAAVLSAIGFTLAGRDTQASPTVMSAFEIMSAATNLPTDPALDAI